MTPENESMRSAQQSFHTAVQADIDQIRAGTTHAMIHIGNTSEELAPGILDKILRELPSKAITSSVKDGYLAIWISQTTKAQTSTVARLVRQILSPPAVGVKDPDAIVRKPCSIGIVYVNQCNWQSDVLMATAQITAALAALSGTNSIRVADQLSPNAG